MITGIGIIYNFFNFYFLKCADINLRETAGTKKRKRNRNKPKQIETIRICHKTLRGKKRGNGSITQSVRSRMISNAPVNIYIYIVK